MFVAKAALNAVGGGMVGEFAIEVLPEFCHDVWVGWSRETNPAERRAELEGLIRASDEEIRLDVDAIVAEIAAKQPEPIRRGLTTFLRQVPAAIRRSQRRAEDPAGTTVRPGLALEKAADLIPLLPARMARFQPGGQPLPGTDWRSVELRGTGGFGEVWLAEHAFLPQLPRVALKFCTDPEAS